VGGLPKIRHPEICREEREIVTLTTPTSIGKISPKLGRRKKEGGFVLAILKARKRRKRIRPLYNSKFIRKSQASRTN